MPVMRPSTMRRARRSRAEMRASVFGSRYLRYSAAEGRVGIVLPSIVHGQLSMAGSGCPQWTMDNGLRTVRSGRLRHRFVAHHVDRVAVQLVVLLARDEVDQ